MIVTCAMLGLNLPVAHAQFLVIPDTVPAVANIGQAVQVDNLVIIHNVGFDTTTPNIATATILNTNEWTVIGGAMKTFTTSTYFDLQYLPQTTSGQDTGTLQITIGGYSYSVFLQGTVGPLPHYSWNPTGFPDGPSVKAIFIEPATGNIFAGTLGYGIYRSTNGGCDWAATDSGLANESVRAIAQAANGALFAATDSGMYRSFDDGISWSASDSGLTNVHLRSLAVISGAKLMAGTNGSGIFVTNDTGTSWKKIVPAPDSIPPPPLGGMDVEALAMNPPGTIFAGTAIWGVLRSTDTGKHWRIVDSLGFATTVTSFTTCINTPGIDLAGSSVGMLRTTDTGRTWTPADTGLASNTHINALATDPVGVVLAATDAGSDTTGIVFQSYDFGMHWIERDSGLPAVHALAISGGYVSFDDLFLARRSKGASPQSFSYVAPLVGTSGGGMYSATLLYCGSASPGIQRQVLLKFRPGHLNTAALCYDCSQLPTGEGTEDQLKSNCWALAYAERFSTSVLMSAPLDSAVRAYGALYLMRNSLDNPCIDTLSIGRTGDTLRSDNYNLMYLYLDNDTSAASLAADLTANFKNELVFAETVKADSFASPPFKPNDALIEDQWNLINIGMFSDDGSSIAAWDIEVGDPSITIAIVDDGLDYRRSEFGGAGNGVSVTSFPTGTGGKVKGGWDYNGMSAFTFYTDAHHGTPVASIAAARTNNSSSTSPFYVSFADGDPGLAGVSGGKATSAGASDDNVGASLVGYAQNNGGEGVSAINNASIMSTDAGETWFPGKAVDVINNSWTGHPDISGLGSSTYSPALHDAVINAYANGVIVVSGEGNWSFIGDGSEITNRWYPADFDPPFLELNVGEADKDKTLDPEANFGPNISLIAPGGYIDGGVDVLDVGSDALLPELFAGGSAATPHVSGVAANLLHYQSTHPVQFDKRPFPEDVQGMIEASCSFPDAPAYTAGTAGTLGAGWGHLQADKLFAGMLNPSGAQYCLKHFTISTIDSSGDGDWSSITAVPVTFVKSAEFGDGLPDPTSVFFVKRKLITGTFTLGTDESNTWDYSKNIYVWGSPVSLGNSNTTNGFYPPNIDPTGTDLSANGLWDAIPYCFIDGTGTTDLPVTFNSIAAGNYHVPGILQSAGGSMTRTITVKSFLYELLASDGMTVLTVGTNNQSEFPDPTKMRLSFSVFGSIPPPGSGVSIVTADSTMLEVWPSITSRLINIGIAGIGTPAQYQAEIYDALGRLCQSLSAKELVSSIDISELASGPYTVRVPGTTLTGRFVVNK